MTEFNNNICTVCSSTTVLELGPDPREDIRCSNCNSQTRVRYLHYILNENFINWKEKKVHEASPAGNNPLAKLCNDYSFSFFDVNYPIGERILGGYNLNLENLFVFDNNLFDYFIAQDVLEHVFRPKLVLDEILRVLKPNGTFIFTVPRDNRYPTKFRISSDDGKEYTELEPPMYHLGIGNSKSLVAIDFGFDLEYKIKEWTGITPNTFSVTINNKNIEVYTLTKK